MCVRFSFFRFVLYVVECAAVNSINCIYNSYTQYPHNYFISRTVFSNRSHIVISKTKFVLFTKFNIFYTLFTLAHLFFFYSYTYKYFKCLYCFFFSRFTHTRYTKSKNAPQNVPLFSTFEFNFLMEKKYTQQKLT